VELFLQGQIKFPDIPLYIQRVVDKHKPIAKPQLEDILEADRWARMEARQMAGRVPLEKGAH
jgi:1-deoxy-D-xylulose-5-phosphate reductoisomerase